MSYTENITVFERKLLFNRIQDIKYKQEKAEKDQLNEIKSNRNKTLQKPKKPPPKPK